MADPIVTGGMMTFEIINGFQQAELVRENGRITRMISDMNAEYAELDAHNVEVAGYSEVARYQTVIDQTLSEQKVANAVNDVDINFGTAAQLTAESKLNGFLNKMDIVQQAANTAMGIKNQARNIRLSGAMGQAQANLNASSVQSSAIIGAAKTGVSGYAKGKG